MVCRSLMITPAFTVLEHGNVALTPDNTWHAGLGALLDRLAAVATGTEIVVCLDRAAAHALKLPAAADERFTEGLENAEVTGWTAPEKPSEWLTFRRAGSPTIIACIMPMLAQGRIPLFDPPNGHVLVPALALWHELTGRAFRGTPGVAGMVLLREHITRPVAAGGKRASITMKPATAGPVNAVERVFDKGLSWYRQEGMEGFRHAYDARRMYLAAAGQCEQLAPWTLKNTGPVKFDRKLAGWWKCELSPWNDERLPNPAGPNAGTVAPVWLTTPTVALLDDLTEAGLYGGVRVIDSWTGPGKRLLRGWAECLEDAYQRAVELRDERDENGVPTPMAMDASRVRATIKEAYRETIGLLNSKSNATWRPDWHYSIIAQARCNLWRTLWRIGRETNRYPISWTATDTVTYESDAEDPEQGAPRGLTIADRLGCFGVKGTVGR